MASKKIKTQMVHIAVVLFLGVMAVSGFSGLVWGEDVSVTLNSGGLGFSPKKVVIHTKDRVIWKNGTDEVHNITSFGTEGLSRGARGNPLVNKQLNSGDEYAYRFQASGTYSYFCAIHTGMWGKVVVQEE